MTRFYIFFLSCILFSCATKKSSRTYEKIIKGQDLEKVTPVSFESFFNQWVYNKKILKIDLNIRQLYKDNQFTYFGRPRLKLNGTTWRFFKVSTDTITERFPNYTEFYGSELKNYLWTNVIPKEDLDLWTYNSWTQENQTKANCPSRKNSPIQRYSLVDKSVILEVTWDVECEELEKLKNKKYTAAFNLLTKEYERRE